MLGQRWGEPSVGNGPSHQPHTSSREGVHRGLSPNSRAEDIDTHAWPHPHPGSYPAHPTQGQAGLELAWESRAAQLSAWVQVLVLPQSHWVTVGESLLFPGPLHYETHLHSTGPR